MYHLSTLTFFDILHSNVPGLSKVFKVGAYNDLM